MISRVPCTAGKTNRELLALEDDINQQLHDGEAADPEYWTAVLRRLQIAKVRNRSSTTVAPVASAAICVTGRMVLDAPQMSSHPTEVRRPCSTPDSISGGKHCQPELVVCCCRRGRGCGKSTPACCSSSWRGRWRTWMSRPRWAGSRRIAMARARWACNCMCLQHCRSQLRSRRVGFSSNASCCCRRLS